MKYKAVVAWVIVLAAAAGAYLVQKTYGKPAMDMDTAVRGSAAAGVPVEVAKAEVVTLAGTATYTGTVAAYVEEDVYPRVMGRIVEMRVYPGDRVEPGQVVARLDDVELGSKVREAAAAVASAEANLAQMEADLVAARQGVVQMEKEVAMAEAEYTYQQAVAARDERLLGKGAIAQQEAESSRSMAAAGRAKVEAARAKVDQAKAMEASALKKRDAMAGMLAQSQAMLRTNEVVRDYVNIRAASPGYVAKRLIAPGTLVMPGMAILKIAQIDKVRFQANVAERDLARLRVGLPVRVRVSGDDRPPLALKVTSIFPFAEGASRTAVVEALAENPGRRFLPGQYVVMEFELGQRGDLVSVPKAALQRLGERALVWTVANEAAVRREVKAGPATADRVAILAGLQAGETVIVSGHENLYQGAKVIAGGLEAAAGPVPDMKGMPGHGAETKVGQPPAAGREGDDLRINLSSVPALPRVGDTRLRIEVKDRAGAPVSGAKIEVSAGMSGMAGPKVAARAAKGPGLYEATVNLGMAGAWTVDVVVTRPQGGTTSAKFNLEAK